MKPKRRVGEQIVGRQRNESNFLKRYSLAQIPAGC
jgi:hypothetical protein